MIQAVIDFINKDGLSTFMIMALGWFLYRQFWPFLTKDVWPVFRDAAKKQSDTLERMNGTLIRIGEFMDGLEMEIRDHDAWARNTVYQLQTQRIKSQQEVAEQYHQSC